MAAKLNSAPPDNPIRVGDVVICEQTLSGAQGPEVRWLVAYATEVDALGIATELRLCGHARTTPTKGLGAQLWVIDEARQAAAHAFADRLRPSDNSFSTADEVRAAITLTQKALAKAKPSPGASTDEAVPAAPEAAPNG